MKDNILRELYYHKQDGLVERYTIPGLDSNITEQDKAISELEDLGYIEKYDNKFRITELGVDFCLNNSFCCHNMPIVKG